MTRSSNRRGALVATAAFAVLTASGCTGDRMPSAPDPGPVHTAVTPRQALQIVNATNAAVVRAVQARQAAEFGGRAVGPAREAFTAAITVQAALRLTPSPPPAPSTPRLILTLAGPWPRWFLVAGPSPASATPVLEVLESADARTPYGLWAQLNLLPGEMLPELASASVGASTLTSTTPGLASTPADTLARYTDLLNRGDSSAYSGQFTADVYRRELTTQLGADRQAFAAVGVGQVLSAHTVAAGSPFAMPTLDGGALVIGRVDQSDTATVTAGKGSVKLDPALAALVGKPRISKSLIRHSVEVLAFHVPKAGTADKISLVAASRSDISATGA